MIRSASLRIVSIAAVLAAGAFAQTPPFTVRVSLPDSTLDLADGGNLVMPTGGIGQSIAASLVVTNRTTQTATINFIQLTGAADFTLSNVPEGSLTLGPGAVFGAQITYKASSSARVTGRFAFNYALGTGAAAFTNINIAGIAPEFIISYIPQGGNQTVLNGTGTIRFPDTPVDGTSNAVLVLANRGTHQGVLNSVTVTGADFQSVGVPVSGTTVAAERELRFAVQYNPKRLEPSRGSVAIETGDRKATYALEGAATGTRFQYEVSTAGGFAPLNPNQAVSLPDTLVGEKSSLTVRFRNSGNADARIPVITASGTGFNLSEVPLLPLLLPAGQSAALTVNFQPTTPGRAAGRLRIGADDFELAGNGLGATVTYAYVTNNVPTTVAAGGQVNFTPAAVGGNSTLRFVIQNTGTAPATVSSIGLAAPSTIFELGTLPRLPLTLEPNGTAGFDVRFSPVALGVSTATLRVDNNIFTLSGAGNAPPPLPPLQFDGASGAQGALQQPAIGLALARAYPLALSGTLTLAFNSDVFSNDPAVQFATGGRTVNFTIPANTTRAIFANNANQIRVQTGSVAGVITLTPAINTTDGGINLTPTAPPQATLTVAPAAPVLLSVALSARTTTSVTLLISGYATSRSVTTIQLNLTPTSGENVRTTQITIPAEAAFLGYYQSAASAAFGSLFTATIPLNFAGDVTNVVNVSDTLQSVSVTIGNRTGTSSAVSLNLR